MADFLDICGVNVPCAELTMKPPAIGAGVTRSANASARANWIARKWHGQGKTAAMQQTDALFLTALLAHQADHWSFDVDLYSDKGRPGAGARNTAAPTSRYGAGADALGIGGTYTFPVDSVAAGWTLLVWNYESAAWHHYVGYGPSGGAGAWLRDGVSHAAPTWWNNGSNASFLLGTSLSIDCTGELQADYIDDLVVIGTQCSATQASALHTFHAAQAWPLAPKLTVSGDFHPVSLTMLGEVGEATNLQGNLLDGAGLKSNLRQLQFEVNEA